MRNADRLRAEAIAKDIGDSFRIGSAYFAQAEASMGYLWDKLVWPMIEDCDFTSVVDLACGHGRNTERLKDIAERVVAMDINEENIAVCRERFAGVRNIEFAVTAGASFDPLPDESVTLVYCFDSMVHFDSDVVRAYLEDSARVLVKGGRGFFHHSNWTSGSLLEPRRNPALRNFMSKELCAHFALKSGLKIVKQKVIPWGAGPGGSAVEALDCLSVVETL